MDSSEEFLFEAIRDDKIDLVSELITWKPGMLYEYFQLKKALQYLKSSKMASVIFSHCPDWIKNIPSECAYDSFLICALESNKSCEIIQEILYFEKNISCNKHGKSPLCFTKSFDVIKLLINNGVNVNVVDRYGLSPLMTAIIEGLSNDILIELINNTSDMNKKTEDGLTVLHLALMHKVGEEIIWEICNKTSNYNIKDEYGLTPLYYGLDNQCNDYLGYETLLFKPFISRAAYTKNFILKLIRKGFDVNADIFMNAVKYCDDFNIVKELTRFIDINCLDSDQNCALHHAMDVKRIRFLLQRGASVHLKNKHGRTPVIEAIYSYKRIEVIELLLSWGSSAEISYFYPLSRDINGVAKIFNLFVVYGMKIDLEDPVVKDILQPQSPLKSSQTFAFLLRKFLIVSFENTSIFKIDVEVSEINKMKQVNIVDGLSFYDFCIKKYKSKNCCIAINDCEFVKNNYEKVKEIFPNFCNEIIGKMMINQNIQKRAQLQKNLFNLTLSGIVQPSVSDSDRLLFSDSGKLNVDCLYLVSHYLRCIDINSLVAASLKE